MKLNINDYRKKVLGCWMGKNIGGTLGAPFEWKRQINNVEFYTQKLDGNPLPNDDLDIQLLWLIALEEMGIDINAHILAEYWRMYVTPYWCEYGTAKVNLSAGLMPPLSGMLNNPYKHSCDAFIRSEIWACIAPGCPGIAVKYAYEDAIIDHGDGEGMLAEIFCTALESSAFVEKDIFKLIDIALSYIPADSAIAKSVKRVVEVYKSGKSWREARDIVLSEFRGSVWMGNDRNISDEDKKKGFDNGEVGYDAPSNIGMIIIGLLYGDNDFEKSILTTVNCGEDTDCTAATVGAIYGIINGIESIPDKWKNPIGKSIKTGCLNLGELSTLGATGDLLPQDIDSLTQRVENIARQVLLRFRPDVLLSESEESDFKNSEDRMLYSDKTLQNQLSLTGPSYKFNFFNITVHYNDGPEIKPNVEKIINIIIENKYKMPAIINIQWYVEKGWTVLPSYKKQVYIGHTSHKERVKNIEFKLLPQYFHDVNTVCRFTVELSVQGSSFVMHVPVVLVGG